MDKSGKEMNSSRSEEYLNYSLSVHCKDDWPTLQCQGVGSKENRSVSFLVKCKQEVKHFYPSSSGVFSFVLATTQKQPLGESSGGSGCRAETFLWKSYISSNIFL